MMNTDKTIIYAFDFDGTLTHRDSLIEFIRYTRGTTMLVIAFLLLFPRLVLMKLGLADNGRTKQTLFSWMFSGMPIVEFNGLCHRFAREKKHLLRSDTMSILRNAIAQGHQVVIVSASIDRWVSPFFSDIDCPDGAIRVLGTQIEVIDGIVTGRFLTPNCYGEEKVNRLKTILTHPRSHYYIYAYGDSHGDDQMLSFADEGTRVK